MTAGTNLNIRKNTLIIGSIWTVRSPEDVSCLNDGMPQSLAPRKCFIGCDMNVEPKKAALAQVTRRIACVRKQLRRRQCLETSWPEHILKASILIFHLSEVACAAEFLRRHCYGSSLEAAESLFVDMFQQTPTEEIVKISLSPPMHALVYAGRFVILHRLWKYVRQQNTCHGVAPSRRELIAEAWRSVPETIDLNALAKLTRPLLGTVKIQQKFLRRFRQAWGARLGRLRALPPAPLHVLQEKAGFGPGVKCLLPFLFCQAFISVLFFGTTFGGHATFPKTRQTNKLVTRHPF